MVQTTPTFVCVDHANPVLSEGLAAVLRGTSDFVVSSGRAAFAEALRQADHATPVVLVTDHQRGTELLGRFIDPASLSHRLRLRVMVVTAQDREAEIRQASRAGVLGYWLQGSPIDELTGGIRMLSRGTRCICRAAAARVAGNCAYSELTPRESEVLQQLVAGSCNAEIARQLGVATGTVKAHVRNIFEKLAVGTRTRAAAFAKEHGLVSPVDSAALPSRARPSAIYRASQLARSVGVGRLDTFPASVDEGASQ